MKKALLTFVAVLTLTLAFCFGVSAETVPASGSCGDNVTYTYNSTTKELVVSGTGAMENYYYDDYDSPFYYSDIKSVVIKSGVTTIGGSAFEGCYSLTSVTIPDSVTTIGGSAFEGCYSLTSVTIPDSVTTIGDKAFSSCNSLTSVTVDKNNEYYSNDDYGVLFDKNEIELIQYPAGNKRKTYTIPDSVTTIGDDAFDSCNNLTSVTIPDSVTTIGDYAFRYCESLTSVTIPDSVTAIGNSAFYFCKSLTSVTIPDSVTAIGSDTFNNTGYYNNVSNWDNSVLYIGNYLIDAKSSITSCDIRQGTRIIAGSAFSGCKSLKNIIIPDSVTSIGGAAFYGCNNLTSVTIPDSVTVIGDRVFLRCSSLESVTIPDSVTTIGDYAFQLCSSLESVTIPDSVTTIGDYAFSACPSLTNVTIPDSVTTIGDGVFSNCYSLTSVTIPDSVTTIGDHAFYYCDSLKDVYYCGTEEQWKKIRVGLSNGSLTDAATMHYNYCGSTHKSIVNISQQNPTCTKVGYTAGKQCTKCKQWISGHEKIAKLGHSYSTEFTVDKKANYTQAGSKSKHCTRSNCTAKTSVTEIPKLILGTVQNLKATSKDTAITLSWNETPGAVGYRVFRYDNGWKILKTTAALTYTETGLSPATNYRFAVRAYVKEGSSVIWAPKYPTISTATAPVPPLTVLQSAGTTNSVTIKWSVCQNTTGYRVFLYNASAKKWETVVAATTKLTSTVSGLKANSKYYVAVRPYTKTDSGYVWGTTYTKILVSTAPTAPTLKVLSSAKNRATIAWGKAAGATGYQVWYSTSPTSGYKKIANYTKNSTYQYNLTSGTTYYYRARAYKAVGGSYVYSAWSPVVSVKIK